MSPISPASPIPLAALAPLVAPAACSPAPPAPSAPPAPGAPVTAGVAAAGARAAERPDIVLITVDTWRADRLHLYGGERATSPALERLAEGALVFDRAAAPASWTLPSLSSVMTGLYPGAHGVIDTDRALPEAALTTAERLSAAGYRTAFFGVNTYLQAPRQLDQGFATYRAWDGLDGRQLTRHVADFLDGPDPGAPLFLELHLYEPHCPYQAPRDLRGRWPLPAGGAAISPERWRSMPDCYRLRESDGDAAVPGREGAPVLELERYLLAYDEELLAVDRVIEELLGVLADRDRLDESLLILAGDHGEAFWEHGDYGHGRELYQSTTWVPLLIRPPGGVAGGRIGTPVSLVDIAPTVLAAAGQGASLAGRDLSPAWGEGLQPAPVFSSTRYEGAAVDAVFDGDWALIRSAGRSALYDLGADPGQGEDLAALRGAERRRLEALLAERQRADAAAALDTSTLSPSEDVLQQLKAIGYMR